jgi:archaellum component FlaC
MADEPDNLVLKYLRRIDEKLDRVIDDVADLKVRTTAVEEALAGVNRRLDRLEGRVERIERRLDLVEAAE